MLANGQLDVNPELRQLAQRAMEAGVVGTVSPQMQQEEQDRRVNNMEYEQERLRAQGREPATGAEWQAHFRRHGFEPQRPLTGSALELRMSYDAFTNRIESCTLMTRFEAENEPDAPRKCENCKVRGAKMRCSNCGEYYCSPTCARRDWNAHRSVCVQAGCSRQRTVPMTLSEDDYGLKVFGRLPRGVLRADPAAGRAGPGSYATAAAAAPAATAAPDVAPGTGKNAKKNKKKREKAKAAKAAGTEGVYGEEKKEEGGNAASTGAAP